MRRRQVIRCDLGRRSLERPGFVVDLRVEQRSVGCLGIEGSSGRRRTTQISRERQVEEGPHQEPGDLALQCDGSVAERE